MLIVDIVPGTRIKIPSTIQLKMTTIFRILTSYEGSDKLFSIVS